jgi:hypothetical protein
MAIIDIDGTAIGTANVPDAPLAVLFGMSEATGGSSSSGFLSQPVQHDFLEVLTGGSSVSASTQHVFNMSGYSMGAGDAIDARVLDAEGLAIGSGDLTGTLVRTIGVQGFTFGSGATALSVPEPIFGVAIVTAYMEVVHVGFPICETPQVEKRFRWGHQFVAGDLETFVTGANGNPMGPVCISFTMYQVQKGCALKQVGPSNRHPGTSRVGCYYATGTAGECGQPGLWVIRWSYQGTFGGPSVVRDCYFYVLDSVLCPVPGDTLVRECKYGWD